MSNRRERLWLIATLAISVPIVLGFVWLAIGYLTRSNWPFPG